ncbi:hypothetical protein M378DRAFT_14594 [Amanita muscaria Koide BX008]|uniref:Uncharacterized protein n=1 Tax=Amanita muscaria (strain Koide BX008) TaxID=946122 RepID=A0A0C2WEC4_AMAMK|nr:hypothetical protein M378DRAFT_14594 [Amanita muscaria Koide BX008]
MNFGAIDPPRPADENLHLNGKELLASPEFAIGNSQRHSNFALQQTHLSMRTSTFSTLIAIVALSIFSVYAAPVHLGGNVHPTVGNVRAVVDVIHTKLNSTVPRDVHDTVHNVPTVDSIPGNVNSIAARAGDDDIVKNIPFPHSR